MRSSARSHSPVWRFSRCSYPRMPKSARQTTHLYCDRAVDSDSDAPLSVCDVEVLLGADGFLCAFHSASDPGASIRQLCGRVVVGIPLFQFSCTDLLYIVRNMAWPGK